MSTNFRFLHLLVLYISVEQQKYHMNELLYCVVLVGQQMLSTIDCHSSDLIFAGMESPHLIMNLTSLLAKTCILLLKTHKLNGLQKRDLHTLILCVSL